MLNNVIDILETAGGKIAVSKVEGDYPGFEIFINGVLAALIEWDDESNNFKVHIYRPNDEEPVKDVLFYGEKVEVDV